MNCNGIFIFIFYAGFDAVEFVASVSFPVVVATAVETVAYPVDALAVLFARARTLRSASCVIVTAYAHRFGEVHPAAASSFPIL